MSRSRRTRKKPADLDVHPDRAGDLIVGELAVHGWDLAVATGQRLELLTGAWT